MEIIFNSGWDIAGLIIFSLLILSASIGSIFAAKWYIWGPKWHAKRDLKKQEKKLKKDGGIKISDYEKEILAKDDSDLTSQQLLTKHKAQEKMETARKFSVELKEEKVADKKKAREEKDKFKEMSKQTKIEEKQISKDKKGSKPKTNSKPTTDSKDKKDKKESKPKTDSKTKKVGK